MNLAYLFVVFLDAPLMKIFMSKLSNRVRSLVVGDLHFDTKDCQLESSH